MTTDPLMQLKATEKACEVHLELELFCQSKKWFFAHLELVSIIASFQKKKRKEYFFIL